MENTTSRGSGELLKSKGKEVCVCLTPEKKCSSLTLTTHIKIQWAFPTEW